MAFVNSTPLTPSISSVQTLRSDLSTSPLRCPSSTNKTASTVTKMGYGDYSYSTDKTKGHTNQYYVDKFRNVYDFAKGQPATEQDAMAGQTIRGSPIVPIDGIPQLDDSYSSLVPISSDVIPDPRIKESDGAVYPWDPEYEDPQFAASTYADVNDELVAEDALAKFRGSMAEDRGLMLSALDYQSKMFNKYLVSEDSPVKDPKYFSCLEGQLNVEFLKLQKIDNPPTLNPTGIPQTAIPGFDYLPSVGALDFMKQEETEIAFWKADTSDDSIKYKKPAGNEMPELPYNKPATVAALKEVQMARDIIPKEE